MSKTRKMLIQHVRDANRIPFATIVALSPTQISFTICSHKDRFNKKFGTNVAAKRAAFGWKPSYPNRWVLGPKKYYGVIGEIQVSTIIEYEYNKMVKRAEKYFK